jgi:hypothetical protein
LVWHVARMRDLRVAYIILFEKSEWKIKFRCPHGLRHELPSYAQTLGSWVRIPLEVWISVCVYSVFVLFCVQVAALRRAHPRPRNPTDSV